MNQLEHKNEYIELEQSNNTQKTPEFSRLRIAFQNQKIILKELNNRELRDRELKLRKEIEELFFKPTNVSSDEMYNFEEKEIMKSRPFVKQ